MERGQEQKIGDALPPDRTYCLLVPPKPGTRGRTTNLTTRSTHHPDVSPPGPLQPPRQTTVSLRGNPGTKATCIKAGSAERPFRDTPASFTDQDDPAYIRLP